ncbi:MAG: NDP-hexose 2,3-dehydratase family protein [Clostridium sp.]|nr:NDP-hexose 2,3-dehydratase family protein [Clostridium sp.]
MSIVFDIVKSWDTLDNTVNSLNDIKKWILARNRDLKVIVEPIDFSYNGFWYYDKTDGYIRNSNNSFFQLAGYQEIEDDQIVKEQPVIIQDEIGYLGIICKKINGILYFLMQAKIEPGNVNVIQISPTIQATKSNFTRQHGGKAPAYLEYFSNMEEYDIIVDQIQSEQSSRFYKKRNRNIVICVEEDIEILDSHKWMTLGQIKELMKEDNLVNMDTRTVLSCLPFSDLSLDEGECEQIFDMFKDKALYNSIFKSKDNRIMHQLFCSLNNYKMYPQENSRLLSLRSLKSWKMTDKEIICRTPYDFKVIYCHIEIEQREVKYWEQPLIEALGKAVLGLFTCIDDGVRKFLVCVKPEIGCFDYAELGPTIQIEPTNKRNSINSIERMFLDKKQKNEGIIRNVVLSEEGGRFYHEENENVIIEIEKSEISKLPNDYFWVDFYTLNKMIQFNNCVNIQLRNLLALLDL